MVEQNRETAQEQQQEPKKEENPFAGFTTEVFDRGEPVADTEERPAETPKKEEVAPPPPKKEGEQPDAETETPEEHPEAAKDDEQKPPPKKPSVQERINEVTRARREAERERDRERQRAEAAEARARELEQQLKTPPKGEKPEKETGDEVDPNEPKPEDFEFGELDSRYIKALANYQADKRFNELRADDQKTRDERAAEEKREKALEKFETMLEKGTKKWEDFYERVVIGAEKLDWPLSNEIGELALSSEVGDEILYHLATHPEEAREVYRSTPLEQARYFGKMEIQFSAERVAASGENGTGKPAPKIPKAPQPIEAARGAGGQFQATADTDDFAAFEQRVNSGG